MTHNHVPETTPQASSVIGVESAPAWPPVRHPFQVSSFGVFLLLGAGSLLDGPSNALNDLVGARWGLVWPIILIVSGLSGGISAIYAIRDEGLSLLTERVALVGVGSFCYVYTSALFATLHANVWRTELIFLFIAIACTWRYRQVRKRIRWLKKVGRTTTPRWRP